MLKIGIFFIFLLFYFNKLYSVNLLSLGVRKLQNPNAKILKNSAPKPKNIPKNNNITCLKHLKS